MQGYFYDTIALIAQSINSGHLPSHSLKSGANETTFAKDSMSQQVMWPRDSSSTSKSTLWAQKSKDYLILEDSGLNMETDQSNLSQTDGQRVSVTSGL